ncbi:hypothetical protein FA09DRAFT_14774 [Tilletiopsis washingtonensis]|uniref:Uncharacterized protein n=1 Tax=Tilletiopsis washingtonensis TaxID=58919 RepID=A0A316ZJV3_9BASI|nr:hypothetical protein FA09DRAFT_14774 [Tilletiopsis washingtonensis]PWO01419.1 hypothetical protein FA09DRAFT_14774 [Tilletiopsis washingtonensis]
MMKKSSSASAQNSPSSPSYCKGGVSTAAAGLGHNTTTHLARQTARVVALAGLGLPALALDAVAAAVAERAVERVVVARAVRRILKDVERAVGKDGVALEAAEARAVEDAAQRAVRALHRLPLDGLGALAALGQVQLGIVGRAQQAAVALDERRLALAQRAQAHAAQALQLLLAPPLLGGQRARVELQRRRPAACVGGAGALARALALPAALDGHARLLGDEPGHQVLDASEVDLGAPAEHRRALRRARAQLRRRLPVARLAVAEAPVARARRHGRAAGRARRLGAVAARAEQRAAHRRDGRRGAGRVALVAAVGAARVRVERQGRLGRAARDGAGLQPQRSGDSRGCAARAAVACGLSLRLNVPLAVRHDECLCCSCRGCRSVFLVRRCERRRVRSAALLDGARRGKLVARARARGGAEVRLRQRRTARVGLGLELGVAVKEGRAGALLRRALDERRVEAGARRQRRAEDRARRQRRARREGAVVESGVARVRHEVLKRQRLAAVGALGLGQRLVRRGAHHGAAAALCAARHRRRRGRPRRQQLAGTQAVVLDAVEADVEQVEAVAAVLRVARRLGLAGAQRHVGLVVAVELLGAVGLLKVVLVDRLARRTRGGNAQADAEALGGARAGHRVRRARAVECARRARAARRVEAARRLRAPLRAALALAAVCQVCARRRDGVERVGPHRRHTGCGMRARLAVRIVRRHGRRVASPCVVAREHGPGLVALQRRWRRCRRLGAALALVRCPPPLVALSSLPALGVFGPLPALIVFGPLPALIVFGPLAALLLLLCPPPLSALRLASLALRLLALPFVARALLVGAALLGGLPRGVLLPAHAFLLVVRALLLLVARQLARVLAALPLGVRGALGVALGVGACGVGGAALLLGKLARAEAGDVAAARLVDDGRRMRGGEVRRGGGGGVRAGVGANGRPRVVRRHGRGCAMRQGWCWWRRGRCRSGRAVAAGHARVTGQSEKRAQAGGRAERRRQAAVPNGGALRQAPMAALGGLVRGEGEELRCLAAPVLRAAGAAGTERRRHAAARALIGHTQCRQAPDRRP